jgi:type IV pilus assembly protein PilM
LSRLKETTSTEKLLNLIRNKEEDHTSRPVVMPEIGSRKGKSKRPSLKTKPVKKSVNIGIDIGHEYLRLVKAAKSGDNKWALIDYRSVPLDQAVSKKSPEFADFLKSELSRFLGANRKASLWANMSAARVNVRHIRIPKVARKHVENAIYWTIKKETPFDEKDTMIDYEIQGETVEDGVQKLSAMVYTAPRGEIEDLKKQFSTIGFPLSGISISPFAIQNMFIAGWFPAVEGTVASLFMGNDFSRIDIYDQGKLTMTRGIKAGVNSMLESLQQRMDELLPEPEQGDETIGVSMKEARKVLLGLDSPPSAKEGDVEFALTEEEKFAIILPALERMIRQVERTFDHYTANLGYERVDKLYISSVINIPASLIEYVKDQLGMESDILDPFKFQLSFLGEEAPTDIPPLEKIALTPALGLALSDNKYTPNFLFSSKDKEKITQVVRMTRAAFTVLIIAALICAGIFFSQLHTIEQKKTKIARLEAQLLQYSPQVDKNLLSQMVVGSKQIRQKAKAYSERYTGIAVIGELSALTPKNIRLIALKVNLGNVGNEKGAKKENPKNLTVEGLVLGDRKSLEVLFSHYLMTLDNSPLFGQIRIQKNSLEPFKKNEALHFIIGVTIG